jgi:hypothetical protein
LNTREEIAAHFERVVAFWRANAGGKKSYFVVNFENVHININEIDFYSKQTQRAHAECAITSVRYGGDAMQRTVTRLAGMKVHLPSNIYETKEAALAVVRKLRAGEISESAPVAKE